jgi:hypothetical protein
MLQLKIAQLPDAYDVVAEENSLSCLGRPPENYLGEYYSPNFNELRPGFGILTDPTEPLYIYP